MGALSAPRVQAWRRFCMGLIVVAVGAIGTELASGAPAGSVPAVLEGVTAYGNRILAVGADSVGYSTQLPCGVLLAELSGAGGRGLTASAPSGPGCSWLNAVAVDPRGGAWAVGYHISKDGRDHPLAEHFDGRRWSAAPTPSPGFDAILTGVAVAGRQVWAVGEYNESSQGSLKTLTMVRAGSAWRVVPSPNVQEESALEAVAGSASGRPWAVGWYRDSTNFSRHTLTMSYGGSGWQVVASPSVGSATSASGNVLSGIAAGAGGTLWAVGQYTDESSRPKTLTLRYANGAWQAVSSPSPGSADNALYGVRPVKGGGEWAVGEFKDTRCQKTLTERYAGGSWRVVPSPNPVCTTSRGNTLHGLAVGARGVLYAVGDTNISSLVERNAGGGWKVVPSPN
jgi:hypothetical protein